MSRFPQFPRLQFPNIKLVHIFFENLGCEFILLETQMLNKTIFKHCIGLLCEIQIASDINYLVYIAGYHLHIHA